MLWQNGDFRRMLKYRSKRGTNASERARNTSLMKSWHIQQMGVKYGDRSAY